MKEIAQLIMVVRIGPDDFPLGKSTEKQEFH
jgi:hypothetical protein